MVLDAPGASEGSVDVKPGPVPGSLDVTVRTAVPTGVEGTRVHSERGPDAQRRELHRVLPVAWDADVSKAKARVENGVVVVTVPRQAAPSGNAAPAKKKDQA